jgi:hypothetical protein
MKELDWKKIMHEVYKIGEVRNLRKEVGEYITSLKRILSNVSDELNSSDESRKAYEKAGNGGFILKEITDSKKSRIIKTCYPIVLNESTILTPQGEDYAYGNRMGIDFDRKSNYFAPSLISHIIKSNGAQEPSSLWIEDKKDEEIFSYLQKVIKLTDGEGIEIEREERLLQKIKNNLSYRLSKGEKKLEDEILKGFHDLVTLINFIY